MAGIDQRLEDFFEKCIRKEGRKKIIKNEFAQLKDSMMVDQLLDQMLSQDVLKSQAEKHYITGHGQGFQAPDVQAERLLERIENTDAKLYIRFLKILNNNQGDLAETLTRGYYDLLSRGDLEERYKSTPAANNIQSAPSPPEEYSPPKPKESGKDYDGYVTTYIESEVRDKILQVNYDYVSKFLRPEDILPAMVSANVITQDQKAAIEGNGPPNKQAQAVLEMLTRMDDEKYVAFLDVLFTKQKNINRKLTGGKYIPGEELRRNVNL